MLCENYTFVKFKKRRKYIAIKNLEIRAKKVLVIFTQT